MTTPETVPLLDAAARVLGAVLWPAVVVLALLLFRQPIRRILHSDDLALTLPGGIEVAAKRRAAASAIIEASRQRNQPLPDAHQVLLETSLLDDVVRERGMVRILWVDDQPSNNREERAALEKLGIVVELSVSTTTALRALARSQFDLVISDMGRPEGQQAGYQLLTEMREGGDDTRVIFYTSSNSAEHFDMAVRNGALGSTAEPGQLVEMVVNALRSGRTRRGGPRVAVRNILRRLRMRWKRLVRQSGDDPQRPSHRQPPEPTSD